MRERLLSFIRREPVLCVAAACALGSMCFVPPSAAYWDYIDLRVLCLLFSLMAVVLGLQACGLFDVLAQRLVTLARSIRMLTLTLVLLPFFTSMLVTNDVALLTFVPLAVLVFGMTGRQRALPWIVVLQTLAANLGSMATQVGNPQNLFLYAYYDLSAGAFFAVTLPVVLVSLALLSVAALCTGKETLEVRFDTRARLKNPRLLVVYLVLFGLCLASVFRLLHYGVLTGIVLTGMLFSSRGLLRRVDYGLLLTFVCFFVFAGNLGALPTVRAALTGLMEKNALLSSVLASQVISNVPAAVLLSGFTDDWRGLLLGVDVGGLGTPIASLASLISMKLVFRVPGVRPLRYLGLFLLANLAALAVLLPLAALLA